MDASALAMKKANGIKGLPTILSGENLMALEADYLSVKTKFSDHHCDAASRTSSKATTVLSKNGRTLSDDSDDESSWDWDGSQAGFDAGDMKRCTDNDLCEMNTDPFLDELSWTSVPTAIATAQHQGSIAAEDCKDFFADDLSTTQEGSDTECYVQRSTELLDESDTECSVQKATGEMEDPFMDDLGAAYAPVQLSCSSSKDTDIDPFDDELGASAGFSNSQISHAKHCTSHDLSEFTTDPFLDEMSWTSGCRAQASAQHQDSNADQNEIDLFADDF